jgi:hypothetical protein
MQFGDIFYQAVMPFMEKTGDLWGQGMFLDFDVAIFIVFTS